MFKYRRLRQLTFFLLFFSGCLYAADPLSIFQSGVQKATGLFQQDDLLPADQAFHFIAEVKDAHTLRVSWQIADGYYLYRDRFRFSLRDASGIELKIPRLPPGKNKQEESGPVEVYYHEVSFDLPLQRSSSAAVSVTLNARFQGCAERGVCYPPMEKTESLDLPADQVAADTETGQKPSAAAASAAPETTSPAQSALLLPVAVLMIVTAVYFGVLNNMLPAADAGSRLKKALLLALLIWGILLLVGAAADSGSLLHPLASRH
jgi:thiol:disulfide interchange protein DsbD